MFGTAAGILTTASLRNTTARNINYTANDIEPDTVCDFQNNYFRAQGVNTSFDEMCTFSRGEDATYFDSRGVMQTATSNNPRYPHYRFNGTEWVNEGLLFERVSNNQVPYSNDPVAGIAAGQWAIYRGDSVTLTANDATGPDNTTSLTRMEITDTTNEEKGVVIRDNNWPISWYSISCFVKDIDQRYVSWWLYSGTNNWALVTYDLQEGTVTNENSTGITIGGSGIEDHENGLYRIWTVMYNDSTTASEKIGLMFADGASPTVNSGTGEVAYAGVSGTGIHCGFFQIEPHRRAPSSYIHNNDGVLNERPAETFYINSNDLTYSSSAYSFAFNGKLNTAGNGGDSTNYLTGWNNGVDNNNRYLIRWSENTGTQFGGDLPWETQIVASGTVYTHTPTTRPQSGYFTDFNVAWRNTTSELNTSINGSTETAISAGLPSITNSEIPVGSTTGIANGDFDGTLATIRQWAADITDGGIVEAASTLPASNSIQDPVLTLDFINKTYTDSSTPVELGNITTYTEPTNTLGAYDSSGNLTWQPHNYFPLGESLNSGWDAAQNITVTPNAITAPDGSNNGFQLTANNTSNPLIYESVSGFVNYMATIRTLCWFRAGTMDGALLQLYNNGGGGNEVVRAGVLVGPGAGGGVGSASGEFTGLSTDEWSLCYADWVVTQSGGTPAIYVKPQDPNGYAGGEYLYAWGVMLCDIANETQFEIPSGFSSVDGDVHYVRYDGGQTYLPRLGAHYWNGSSWQHGGLALETIPRDICYRASQTIGSARGQSNVSIDRDRAESPVGITQASGLRATSTSNPFVYDESTNHSQFDRPIATFWCQAVTKDGFFADFYQSGQGSNEAESIEIIQGPGNAWIDGARGYVNNLSTTEWTLVRVVGRPITFGSGSSALYFKPLDPDGEAVGDEIRLWGIHYTSGTTRAGYPVLTRGARPTGLSEALAVNSTNMPFNTGGVSGYFKGVESWGDAEQLLFKWEASASEYIRVKIDTSGDIVLEVGSGASTDSVSVTGLTNSDDDIPVYVAWSVTPSNISISFNGVNNNKANTLIAVPAVSATDANLEGLGMREEIKFWDRGLTPTELNELTAYDAPSSLGDYIIYLDMQNVDNTTVTNNKTNPYIAERTGYVSKLSHPDTWTNGVWFDGVDDYVRVSENLGTTLIPVDSAWSVTFEYYPRHTVDVADRIILGAQYNQSGALWDVIRFDFDPATGAPRFWVAREGQAEEKIVPDDGSGNTIHWGGDAGRYTITCDDTNNLNFYYEDNLLGTGSFSSANHPTSRLLDQFEIGAVEYGGGGGNTSGVGYGSQIISHLAIYTGTELTAQEVSDIASGSSVPYTPSLEMNFDNNTGTTVSDTSGNARNGTISGALWMATDTIPDENIPNTFDGQGALHFNGAADTNESHIQISNTTGLVEDGTVSVSLWFWVDPDGLNRRQFLWSTQAGSGTGRGVRIESDNTLQGVANGSSQLLTNTTDYPIGGSKWYHCVYVREPDGTGRLYLDGQEIDSNSAQDDRSAGADLTIGNNTPESTFDRKFQGWIDDFRIYGRALSSSEVNELYEMGTELDIFNLKSSTDTFIVYDPSDTDTLITGAQGSRSDTLVNNDPVEIILDKGRKNEWSGELISNGTFDTDTTGWTPGDAASTLTQESGKLRITNGDATAGYAILDGFTPTIGATYIVKFEITGASVGTNFRFLFGGFDSSGTLSTGSYIYILTPSTTGSLILSNGNMNTSGAWVEWDNVSLQEIPGVHMQSGPASGDKPLLKIDGNSRWLETDGGADMSIISGTGDSSSFNFLHDGTGGEFGLAVKPSGSTNPGNLSTIFSTGDWATAEIGASFGIEDRSGSGNNAWRWFISAGSNGNPAFDVYTNDVIPDTTLDYITQGYYQEGFSPEYNLDVDQVSIYSGASTNPPSTSNATGTMTLFDRPSKSFGMSPGGRNYASVFIDRVLTSGERKRLHDFLSGKLPPDAS